jgi:hypothetical protein
MFAVILALILQQQSVWLENDYVRVTRNRAPCAAGVLSSAQPGCGDRVLVAMSDIEIGVSGARRRMVRGDIAVFREW